VALVSLPPHTFARLSRYITCMQLEEARHRGDLLTEWSSYQVSWKSVDKFTCWNGHKITQSCWSQKLHSLLQKEENKTRREKKNINHPSLAHSLLPFSIQYVYVYWYCSVFNTAVGLTEFTKVGPLIRMWSRGRLPN